MTQDADDRYNFSQLRRTLLEYADGWLPYAIAAIGLYALRAGDSPVDRLLEVLLGSLFAVLLLQTGLVVAAVLVAHLSGKDPGLPSWRHPWFAGSLILAMATFGVGRHYAIQSNRAIAGRIANCVTTSGGNDAANAAVDSVLASWRSPPQLNSRYEYEMLVRWCALNLRP